jgi:hypothetical protein
MFGFGKPLQLTIHKLRGKLSAVNTVPDQKDKQEMREEDKIPVQDQQEEKDDIVREKKSKKQRMKVEEMIKNIK